MKKKKIIILSIIAVVVLSLLSKLIPMLVNESGTITPQPSAPVISTVSGDDAGNGAVLSKTVMIYLDGADLEENSHDSTRTIYEILNSGVNTEYHNILLYTGGCNQWRNFDIPADKDCIYILKNGTLQLLQEYQPQNMGQAQTLQTFMQYCVTNYPAQQYGLILHNHGAGPNGGVCSDYRNDYDMLNISELQTVFSQVGFGPNGKMEFVIFDACLMASSEVANGISDYAHYMVASENVSYVFGSDYSFIKSLDEYNSGADIGKRYVDCFYTKSTNLGNSIRSSGKSVYDITYSCIKLSEMAQLEFAINNLFKEANASPNLSYSLSSAAHYARGVMEYADSYGLATDTIYDLIDLTDWMNNTSYAYRSLTDSVRAAVNNAVIYNRSSTSQMHGLTIYYPKNAHRQHSYNQLGFSDEYSEYVRQCYIAAQTADTSVWNNLSATASAMFSSTQLTVNLTPEQADNYASAQYYILAQYSGLEHTFAKDEYILVDQGNDCSKVNNAVSAKFDYRVPVLYRSDGVTAPFCSPIFRKKTDDGHTVYSTHVGLQYVPDSKDFPGERDENGLNELLWKTENMRLDVAWLTMEENGGVLDILYGEIEGTHDTPSRMLVNPDDYQTIQFFNPIRSVKYDTNGKILPVSQWEVDTKLTLTLSENVDDITIRLQRLPEEVKYYGVIVVKDIYGHEYTTDMIALN